MTKVNVKFVIQKLKRPKNASVICNPDDYNKDAQ